MIYDPEDHCARGPPVVRWELSSIIWKRPVVRARERATGQFVL